MPGRGFLLGLLLILSVLVLRLLVVLRRSRAGIAPPLDDDEETSADADPSPA